MGKLRYYILLLTLVLSFPLIAQSFCTTTAPPQLNSSGDRNSKVRSDIDYSTYLFKVYFHVVRYANGQGGITLYDVREALDVLNEDFNPHDIYFEWEGTVDYINNSYYAATPSSGLYSINNHLDGIDIYLCPKNSVSKGHSAGFGQGTEMFVSGCDDDLDVPLCTTHVISHEMGHLFNLYHTFHGTQPELGGDTYQCAELVDGSNSDTCGDYVEDTPADPGITQQSINLSTCQWTLQGTLFDSQGRAYTPDTHLIMSYTRPQCMEYFTPMQGERMRNAINAFSVLQNALVPPTIIGPTIPCDSTVYIVANIPSSYDVAWIANEPLASLITDSLYSRCVINNSSHTYVRDSLFANITDNGNNVTTLRKRINTGQNVTGTYTGTYQGSLINAPIPGDISGTFHSGGWLFVVGGYKLTLSSSYFSGYVTCSGNGISSWSKTGSTLTIETNEVQSTTNVIVSGFSGYNVFQLLIKLTPPLIPILSVHSGVDGSGSLCTFTLAFEGVDSKDDMFSNYMSVFSESGWVLTVSNMLTGKSYYIGNSNSSTQTLATDTWPSGMYIAQARLGDVILTSKFVIQK